MGLFSFLKNSVFGMQTKSGNFPGTSTFSVEVFLNFFEADFRGLKCSGFLVHITNIVDDSDS